MRTLRADLGVEPTAIHLTTALGTLTDAGEHEEAVALLEDVLAGARIDADERLWRVVAKLCKRTGRCSAEDLFKRAGSGSLGTGSRDVAS